MDERQELRRRRQAIRLRLQGISHKRILEKVHRSRAWLSKWQHRYDHLGYAGLRSVTRRPHHLANTSAPRIVRLIIQTRRRLVKQKVGLIGARAIRHELRLVLEGDTPSLSTIHRVLRTHGLLTLPVADGHTYFPRPLTTLTGILHAMDWTCRYLEDGPKIYAFHTLNLHTRACTQTIATDKRTTTVIGHCWHTWETLGIPQFLQLDNDAAFCGGYKAPRLLGTFVRLCLYLGIELIFLPIAEPECNGEVEELNGLWSHAFWERRVFQSVGHVKRASPAFVRWYMTRYVPPALGDKTPRYAQHQEPSCPLRKLQWNDLPHPLPITAGRVHFLRKVAADGTIQVLNETWRMSKRLAGRYIWAMLTTHCHRLEFWYQRSAQYDWQLLKTVAYPLSETVARLKFDRAHAKPI